MATLGALKSRVRALTAVLLLAIALPVAAAHADTRVRKDVKDLTAHEKAYYVGGIRALKHVKSPYGRKGISLYDALVYYHRRAFGSPAGGAHMGPAFLPWHREFLLAFENAVRNTTSYKHFTVPYWDWTDPASTAAAFGDDLYGGDGDPAHHHAVMTGPFRRGRWVLHVREQPGASNPLEPEADGVQGTTFIQRAFGTDSKARKLPTSDQMDAILGVNSYDAAPWSIDSDPADSFRCALEGWRGLQGAARGGHNAVHLWVAGLFREHGYDATGTIGGAASPNDPLFWSLHANVDRLWTQWEAREGAVFVPQHGAPKGQNLDDRLGQFSELGFTLTPHDLLSPTRGGVIYQPPLRP